MLAIWPKTKTLSLVFFVWAVAALVLPASAVAQVTVTGVSPSAGPAAGGATATITGTNFSGAPAVTFGGNAATNVVVVSATSITATLPPHGGAVVDVTVAAALGSGTKTAAYTYVSPPKLTGVTPNSGPSVGGTSVTISGLYFTNANVVKFGMYSATSFTVVNATTIIATTPLQAAALVPVRVSTPLGGQGSLLAAYTYIPAALLTVTKKFVPSSDPGKVNLRIDGVNRANFVGNGGTTGSVTVATGSHTVSEIGFSGTNLHNYTQRFSGSCNSSGVVSLGQNVSHTCVITNTRRGWFTRAPMPAGRYGIGVGVINGVLYAVGGKEPPFDYVTSRTEAYNPATDTWTTKLPMPTARDHLGVGVVNGVLYAFGGGTSAGTVLTKVEAYNPGNNTWTTKAQMPVARYYHSVGVVAGIVYVVGGDDSNYSALATTHAYDPPTNTWTTKAQMPTARSGLAVGVINGILYAVGGDSGFGPLKKVEAYDPATNSWTTKAPMPTARWGLGVAAIDGILYAVGGTTSANTSLNTVEAYDPATNTWTTEAQMPTARYGLGVGVIDGVLYAVGGATGGIYGWLATTEAYNP